jgi:pimeloyl-ACP methyl ester carboxylesterase
MNYDRRRILQLGAFGAASLWRMGPLRAQAAQADALPPILFVHGNGDHAALWQTVVWRFDSNGYPGDRLIAFNFTDPLARDDDSKPQDNRSSTDDQLRELTAQIDEVRTRTRVTKVALIGNSRGGNAIRNYVSRESAAKNVSHIVLCGTPNHGIFAWDTLLGYEFNGRGPFLSRLNAQPDEISPGPAFLTLRSDGQDKYAQPDGRFVGKPGTPTNVAFEGPELKGAKNLVLGALDHRETAFHPRAFREMYKFIAGVEPSRIAIAPEQNVRLSGLVTGLPGGIATNRPIEGALVEIFATSAETGARMGDALYRGTTGPSGAWGPVTAPATAPLEFVIATSGYPTTHIYRSPFPRSLSLVHLRPGRPLAAAEANVGAVVVLSRPRGYFGLPRDVVLFDGREPIDVKSGVPADSVSTLRLSEFADRPIVAEFNEERIVCRPWPARDNHQTIAELTY